jgi:glycosyltransferase involved in cell wall biosynthesis
MAQKNNSIIIQVDGYPYKISASNAKNELFAKTLIDIGYKAYLVSKSKLKGERSIGKKDGIVFRFFNRVKTRSRIISYIYTKYSEILFLRRIKNNSNHTYYLISYNLFFEVLVYWIFSKIIGFKLVINIMEWHKAIAYKSFLLRFNAYLFDSFSFVFADGTIAISDYIFSQIKMRYPKHSLIKVPVMTDCNLAMKIKGTELEYEHFLYCGDVGYYEVIEFIINFYKRFLDNNTSEVKLLLVLSGNKNQISLLIQKIETLGLARQVMILNGLDYSHLIAMYKSAICLLIPLRKTIQDLARFPHKIGEYSSTGTPILTTKWGEVDNYFTEKKNIYFTENYNENEFAQKLKNIVDDTNIKNVGLEAKNVCLNHFHYSNYSNKIDCFLRSL